MSSIITRYEAGELITDICEGENMPSTSTVYDWIDKRSNVFNARFLELFTRAKEKAGHSHSDNSLKVLNKSLSELKNLDAHIVNAYATLIKHKSNVHARLAGYHNKTYNDKLLAKENENKPDADIEI